ncbi:MAG: DNA replication/repair protein RecF [Paludibacteraceae bacterium]
MTLKEIHILNYKNIRETNLRFAEKLNCFVGLNGQGKTNLLDAIYLLSFAKSAYTPIDSLNINHGEEMAMVQGVYEGLAGAGDETVITCGLKRGRKKQFRRDKTDYKRLIDHIGLIPLVMVSPADGELIAEGSDERRRFMDVVISQCDKTYLEHLTTYNALLRRRNALLKQYAEAEDVPWDVFEVIEAQMVPLAQYIHASRSAFTGEFVPLFQELYDAISGGAEEVGLQYISQLQDRDLSEAFIRTRQRDLILGWTSQGIHKDEIEMLLDSYPLKRVGSQGQQKSYLLAMKLAQARYLGTPILLLDDIFDKLDSERVTRIVEIVNSNEFGQIFITDTDRQHLTDILRPNPEARIFHVEGGRIQ